MQQSIHQIFVGNRGGRSWRIAAQPPAFSRRGPHPLKRVKSHRSRRSKEISCSALLGSQSLFGFVMYKGVTIRTRPCSSLWVCSEELPDYVGGVDLVRGD